MKRNRIVRLLVSMMEVILCMTAFSVTAFASGGEGEPDVTGETAALTSEPAEEPTTGGVEPESQPLTPKGRLYLSGK